MTIHPWYTERSGELQFSSVWLHGCSGSAQDSSRRPITLNCQLNFPSKFKAILQTSEHLLMDLSYPISKGSTYLAVTHRPWWPGEFLWRKLQVTFSGIARCPSDDLEVQKLILLMVRKSGEPVDMVNIPLFTRLHTCWVVQDFFHQQYHLPNELFGLTWRWWNRIF